MNNASAFYKKTRNGFAQMSMIDESNLIYIGQVPAWNTYEAITFLHYLREDSVLQVERNTSEAVILAYFLPDQKTLSNTNTFDSIAEFVTYAANFSVPASGNIFNYLANTD
jgi:hypothetical protein